MMNTQEKSFVYPIMIPTQHSLKSFNFYLFEDAGSLSLIDAGVNTDECWDVFIKTMSEVGYSLNDLDQIILTHNHQDHIGLINRIQTYREIPVYAHHDAIYRLKRDRDFLLLRIEFFDQLYKQMGCGHHGVKQVQKMKEAFVKNEKNKIQTDVLPLAESDMIAGLKVIETPGHSPDHIALLDEKRKLLFGGDHLISHISSNAIIEPNREGKRILTLVEYISSLKKCLHLDVDIVYSGHGKVIQNHTELIKKRLKNTDDKLEKILNLIRSGVMTASDLARTYYKRKYESQFYLVMSEIIGHLDLLEEDDKVKVVYKDGIYHYTT